MKKTLTFALVATLALVANQAYASERGSERPPARPEFSTLDTNQDGQIEWDEFANLEMPHGTSDEAFQSMDINEDGFVSEQEYLDHKPPRRKRR